MTVSDKTKTKFAEALRKLLKKKEFTDIKVSDLCRELDYQRATFYYHFEDKYALVAWVYVNSQKKVYEEAKGEYSIEQYVKALDELKADTSFYRKTLSDGSMTGLYKHIIQYYSRLFEKIVLERTGKTKLDKEIMYSIRYATCAGFFMTRDWLFGVSDMTSRESIENMVDNMPERLRTVLFLTKKKY